MIRREYTNGSGYVCPTENEAIYRADRGIKDSYTAPGGKKKVETLKPKKAATPPKPKDENLKRARQLYSALCCIAGMMDVTITNIELKCKQDPYRYRTVGEKKAIERVQA